MPAVSYSSDLEDSVQQFQIRQHSPNGNIFNCICCATYNDFIEIEKQHPKHILYGVFTLFTLCTAIYIIKTVFELNFVLI